MGVIKVFTILFLTKSNLMADDKNLNEDPEENQIWQNLVQFWTELDRIGIDMYRSFAFPSDRSSPFTKHCICKSCFFPKWNVGF